MKPMLEAVFIPALLCDERLYHDVITTTGDQISSTVLLSPKPTLAESCKDILSRAPSKFILIGTSYGGNLALEIALTAPERVAGLWLMGCDPGAPQQGGPDLAGGLEATPDAVIGMLSGLVVRPVDTKSAGVFKEMAAGIGGVAGAAQARALGSRTDCTNRLAELKMPVLITWGADDPLVPVAVGAAMAAKIPDATFEVLTECGHLPTLEQPARSAELFAELIARVRAASGTHG
jgi:pimeloyl-ACP methyl ester carboxylesterase